jgi:hypothetical protein
LNDLVRIITEHTENVVKKVKWYKWFGFFLLMAIPLLSAFLSFLINIQKGDGNYLVSLAEWTLPWLSLIVTVLTILNSIFKPAERFSMACHMGIELDVFKRTFLIDMGTIKEVDDDKLAKFVNDKSEKFRNIQENLIHLFLPQKT